jgi:hypothetical protein
MITYQVKLKKFGKGIWVTFPEDFPGQRTDTELEIFLDQAPTNLSRDEITYIRDYFKKHSISNELEETDALFLDANDPIAKLDHDQLDQLEENLNLQNTRNSNAGGERALIERVLIIRESYSGNDLYEVARAFLSPSKSEEEKKDGEGKQDTKATGKKEHSEQKEAVTQPA